MYIGHSTIVTAYEYEYPQLSMGGYSHGWALEYMRLGVDWDFAQLGWSLTCLSM